MTVKKKTEPQVQVHDLSKMKGELRMIGGCRPLPITKAESRRVAVQQRASLALASTILCEAGARPVSQKGG
jgi:hypothetical protein